MTSEPFVWEVDSRNVSLEALLSWVSEERMADHLLLSMRLERAGNGWRYVNQEAGDRLKRLFGPFLVKSFHASAWPGTEVIGVPGEVSIIKFDAKVKDVILQTQPDLNKWLHISQPALPEDLCLFRSNDAWPSLVSVTHEKQAWLIDSVRPNLLGIGKSDLQPKQLFFEGSYFSLPYRGSPSRHK